MSSWIATSSGIRGLDLNYVTNKSNCGAELYIDRGKDSQEVFSYVYVFDEWLPSLVEPLRLVE